MIKHALIVVLVLGFGQGALGQDFYDVNTVHTIQLVFTESNWDQILDNLYAAGDEERLLGTAYIDGIEFDSVGVRYKGNSTYSANRVKNPLNIKLDYIIDDQLIDGYGTLKLANSWNDPSFVREVLSYEIARKYMPACLSNYANVYVNGTLIGLYVSVEDVDNLFLRNYFNGSSGAFFKGEFEGMMNDATVWGYLGTDSTSYMGVYELHSDEGWPELIEFLDTLNNYTDAVEEVLDIDRHLWMLAFDILLVNLDAPVNMAHNYYLYQDGTDRFNPIIWDLNMSFGGFTQLNAGGPGSNLTITQMQQLTPLFNATSTKFPVVSKILSNTEYRKMYFAHLKTMLQENFSNDWYETRAYELQDIIDTYVEADPYKLYTYSAFITNVASAVFTPQPICGIVQLMDVRTAYLSSYSTLSATQPGIANVTASTSTASPHATVWITASIDDATDAVLAYRSSSGDQFEKVTMVDDGAHHDGASGDGVFGASITTAYTDVQYYLYAENDVIGAFSPVRAEFELYTLPVAAGGLIVNEFMASNAATLMDPAGEYDDWVELYNNSGSAVDLEGYYLSDNASEPTKWAFPAVTIGDGEYLLIWADEDLEQEGVHADFKLSASGEVIILSDPAENVLDEVTFGAQTDDVSTGRCPDGTGDFAVQAAPSPGEENACGGTTIDLVINEFMASNGSTITDPAGEYADWIELYNNGESAVDLEGYYLSDDASAPTKWSFPAVSIGTGEYLIVWADEDLEQDGVHADFKLSASGEAVVLTDPELNTLDEVSFGAQTEDISTGRCPNATGDFAEMTAATPGAANYCAMDVNLAINEFMASNGSTITDPAGEYADWIELYNRGDGTVDLEGYYLSDNAGSPTKWSFPAVSIGTGEYLIVWADEDLEQDGVHADFKLSASGEAVILSDPYQNVLDEVTFGAQTEDISTGRCPNATGDFAEMTTATPGAANECGGGNCCQGRTGDANNSGDDEPTIGDIGALVDALFISASASALVCMTEVDVNQSGGISPVFEDITIGDIGYLIAYLFINGPYDAETNPSGTILPDCL